MIYRSEDRSPLNSNQNPIENLKSIIKIKLHEDSKEYNSKADIWEWIKIAMSGIEPEVNK